MNLQSISNRELTILRKLNHKKYRQKEQLFFVEGVRAVEQMISNDKIEIKELFFDYSQQYWKKEQWKAVTSLIDSSTIGEDDFAEISDTDTPQGVIALCEMPAEADLQELTQNEGVVLATDAIQNPGNLGTIIRTASWFGVRALLSGKGTVDLFHPKVVRSTAGATGLVPHANVDMNKALSIFEGAGWQIVLLDSGLDSNPLSQTATQQKMIVVVGNEAHGLDSGLYGNSRKKVRITSPRNGRNIESLNAAVATSIALYALT